MKGKNSNWAKLLPARLFNVCQNSTLLAYSYLGLHENESTCRTCKPKMSLSIGTHWSKFWNCVQKLWFLTGNHMLHSTIRCFPENRKNPEKTEKSGFFPETGFFPGKFSNVLGSIFCVFLIIFLFKRNNF